MFHLDVMNIKEANLHESVVTYHTQSSHSFLWDSLKIIFVASMKTTGAVSLKFLNQTLRMTGLYLK